MKTLQQADLINVAGGTTVSIGIRTFEVEGTSSTCAYYMEGMINTCMINGDPDLMDLRFDCAPCAGYEIDNFLDAWDAAIH